MNGENITEKITAELRASIQQHMPGLVGQELMSLLDEAKKTAEANATLTKNNQDLVKNNSDLANENGELRRAAEAVAEREREVKGREDAVHARELKMDLLQLRVDMTEQKLALGVDLFKTVFANRGLRETVTTSEFGSQTVHGQYGQTSLPSNANRTETREVTES